MRFARYKQDGGIPSQRKFAVLLGINGRTLAKLYADPPDASLSYGSVQQMFSNLMTSVWTECNTTEDVNQELSLLYQPSANVLSATFLPRKELDNKALDEIQLVSRLIIENTPPDECGPQQIVRRLRQHKDTM